MLDRVEAVCCRLPELLLDDVVVPLSDDDEEVLEDVLVEDDSGAVFDDVVVLELVEVEVSLGAVLVLDVDVLDGADAITIGELDAAALRSVEKATVVGAVVLVVVPLLVV